MIISKIKVKTVFLAMISVLYVLWGTSWDVPVISLPPSYFLIATCLCCIIFLPEQPIMKEKIIPLMLFAGIFLLNTPFSLSAVYSSNDISNDLDYLVNYDFKIILNLLLLFGIVKVFKTEEDFKKFSFLLSLTICILAPLLIWRYIFVFDVLYVGVELSEPRREGKNSFAMAMILIFPFLLINMKEKKLYKYFSVFAALFVVTLAILINSRSAIIVLFLISMMYFFFAEFKGKKMLLFFSVPIILIILSTFSILEFLTKTGSFSDGLDSNETASISILTESHRGFLAREAITGSIENVGFPHGTATFRIRPTNQGSRTETHNDHLLILYEQGLVGLLLMWFIFFNGIYSSFKKYKKYKDSISLATFLSLIGLFIAMFFINILQSLIFWLFFGMSLCLENINKHSGQER